MHKADNDGDDDDDNIPGKHEVKELQKTAIKEMMMMMMIIIIIIIIISIIIIILIQRMWNVKTKVIPAIIGATGTISKTFRKYVSNIPGNHEVKELLKTAEKNNNNTYYYYYYYYYYHHHHHHLLYAGYLYSYS